MAAVDGEGPAGDDLRIGHRRGDVVGAGEPCQRHLVEVVVDDAAVGGERPGLVPTDLAIPLTADTAVVDDYLDQIPLAKLATADDIAAAVRFLVGPESALVTGQVFAVDGGHTLRRGPRVDTMVETFFGAEAVSVIKPAQG